ncbi:MAG: hypothetical protein CL484_03765 [Acidobacteria bacterium]|nr:hypothetical protein [Acidobacteriota bacterium]|tara:strand:- start:514 stop:753 length:240 start_codon:yes stop_codon:yes gene_type:complete
MKVFLLVQYDPLYLPKYLDSLIHAHDFVGAAILSKRLPGDSVLRFIARYVNLFGFGNLILMGGLVLFRRFTFVQQYEEF